MIRLSSHTWFELLRIYSFKSFIFGSGLYRYNQGWRGGAFDNPIGHTAEVKVGFAAPAGHYNEVDLFIFDQFKNFRGRFADTDMTYIEWTGIEKFFANFVQP
jgi:hypothetical protein